mmetsp:Transcript_33926/g.75554  ORF Transcript_33926/g.75554 Transcript_33926/m.75554 type:complete len:348 (+) Transcript_33926:65-1108(+)
MRARHILGRLPQAAARFNAGTAAAPGEGVAYVNGLAALLGQPRCPVDTELDLRMSFAAVNVPHPAKAKTGGEDSYFACTSTRTFGIADGVGGWIEEGVDVGEYARHLMRYAHEDLSRVSLDQPANLREALLAAATRVRGQHVKGSCTALLGHLSGSTLGLLNLGDSGALVLRPALRSIPGHERPLLVPRLVFRSCEQTHYFNCPYQVSSEMTEVEEPDLIRLRLEPGDLVIACSDGVLDNLFDKQIQQIAGQAMASVWLENTSSEAGLEELAVSLATHAQQVATDETKQDKPTPWSVAARSEGLDFPGGKLDDTTVVVALAGLAADDSNLEAPPAGHLPELHNFKLS